MKRFALAAGALMLCASLAACGDGATPAPAGQAWPTGAPLDVSGPVWATGATVHLGGGGTIDVRHPIAQYAVAGDAVWFLLREDDADDAPDRRLWRATRTEVAPTAVRASEVAATSDGRYLVYLDDVTGPKDRYGTAAHVLVAVDTRTGEETLRTSEGMDEAGGVGLSEAYEDYSPYLAAVDGHTAYVRAIGDVHSYDLATGEVARADEAEVPGSTAGAEPQPVWNSDHTWAIQPGEPPLPEVLRAHDGRLVDPATGTPDWTLVRWVDEDTVVARGRWTLEPGSDYAETDRTVLLTCDVPAGSCDRVPGTMREARQEPVLLPGRRD